MKQTFTLLTAIAFSILANAQITIDSSDLGSIGDNIIIVSDLSVTGKTVVAGSSTAQTFDYTNLNPSTGDTIAFLDPSGSVGAGVFSNANLMIKTGEDLIYAIKTVTSFDVDGIYGDPLDAGVTGPVNFVPNVRMMQFPLTYNGTYTSVRIIDTVIVDTVVNIFDSLRLKSTTNITSTVDAFGTLNLPTTSATVLRKHDVEITNDTVWGLTLIPGGFGIWTVAQTTTNTVHYYRFIAKNKSYFMMEVKADDQGNVLTADFQTDGVLIAGITKINPVKCYGQTNGSVEVGVIGGTPPYSYLWNNGAITYNLNGLAIGSYEVTVTDANLDTYVALANVTQPDSIDVTANAIGADHGLDDGFIRLDINGGTPSFSYDWSNGEKTKDVSGLSFGTYTVTVLDNNGCTKSNSFIVDDITGIKDAAVVDVSIYPNPTTGMVTINTAKAWGLNVVDLRGKRVATTFGNGVKEVDLTKLGTGIYFMLLTIDGDVYQSKLQVIK